jgi:hypothetical protein
MNTRKPKPTFQSMIELPSEELRLQTITVDVKPAAGGDQMARAERLSATRVIPQRRKVTLH